MKFQQLKTTQRFFDLVRAGSKRFEGRLCDDRLRSFRSGDTLVLYVSPINYLLCRIGNVRHYDSFEQMLKANNFKDFVPDVDSFETALDVYYSFPNYSPLVEEDQGVLRIELVDVGLCDSAVELAFRDQQFEY